MKETLTLAVRANLDEARDRLHKALSDCEALRPMVDPTDHSEAREPFNEAWTEAYARGLEAARDYVVASAEAGQAASRQSFDHAKTILANFRLGDTLIHNQTGG